MPISTIGANGLNKTEDFTIDGLTVGQGGGNVASNTVVGAGSALAANTSGANNTGLGYQALRFNTTASNNTAVGYQAAYSNTTGVQHTAVGVGALYSNTTGDSNNAFGRYALNANTTGADNVSIGRNSLLSNTTGSYNVAVGNTALNSNTTASYNTAVGYQAGYSATTSGYMTAIGRKAFYALNNGNLDNFGSTAVGQQAGEAVTTGLDNAFFGGATGSATTTGSNNTALGCGALRLNTTASNNTAVGYQAGYTGTFSGFNTYIGYQAGYTANFGSAANTYNTFVGAYAGQLITTGAKNTIIGGYNGNLGGLDIRTSSNYIVLSDGDGNPTFYLAPNGYADAWINATSGQRYAQLSFAIGSSRKSQIYWDKDAAGGAGAIFVSAASGGVYLTNTGTSWISNSDERLKENLVPIQDGLNKVCSLRSVIGNFISDEAKTPHPFLIAQDVQQVLPEAVTSTTIKGDETNTEYLGVSYTETIPLLVAAIKELNAKVEALEAKLASK